MLCERRMRCNGEGGKKVKTNLTFHFILEVEEEIPVNGRLFRPMYSALHKKILSYIKGMLNHA